MKFKYKFLLAIITAVVSSAFAISLVNSEKRTVFNSNVEALTRGEWEPGKGKCWNTITSSEGELVLYCPLCVYVPGHHAFLSGSGEC